jgi:predicted O-methyltransferase YrrM
MLIRPLVPRVWRWYFEGHPDIRGQLWAAERRLLYETIRTFRPLHCFEIGTWRGGGSTLFAAQGLYENGRGILHTIESDKDPFLEAKAKYDLHLRHLLPHIEFYLGDYREAFPKVLSSVGTVDCLILDGAEDAQESREQYQFFFPHMNRGSCLLVHDWFTEKARLVRAIVQTTGEWEVRKVMGPPLSVGLGLAIRR